MIKKKQAKPCDGTTTTRVYYLITYASLMLLIILLINLLYNWQLQQYAITLIAETNAICYCVLVRVRVRV